MSEMAEDAWGNIMRFENLLRMGVFWTVAVIFSYARLLYQKVFRSGLMFSRSPRIAPTSSTHGQRRLVCIVTGASSGIGKATAEALALHGYHVILGEFWIRQVDFNYSGLHSRKMNICCNASCLNSNCDSKQMENVVRLTVVWGLYGMIVAGRSRTRLLEVLEFLKGKHENVSLEAMELDLCSVSSILSFTEAVKKSLQTFQGSGVLQLLVNNAGILAASQRYTAAASDSMMTTNYLGPYLLTQLLRPIFHQESPQARIVNVTSFTHRCVKAGHVDEKQLAQGSLAKFPLPKNWYSIAQVYENSKLCLLLFTYELHRRFNVSSDASKISVMAADPGIVKTNIMRELPDSLVSLAFFVLSILGLLQDPLEGSKAVIDAALAPEGVSGKYFFGGNGRIIRSSALSYDTNLSKQLWRISTSLCARAIASEDQ